MRLLYSLGVVYVGLCAALVWRGRPAPTPLSPVPSRPIVPARAPHTGPVLSGPEWFQQMKPFCNPVEVETRVQWQPPPETFDGTAYGAGCFALAGKIARARGLLETLSGGERAQAANIVFELAHPVADAGDDQSAGPIMGLVVEFSPRNYMALYHAGASEFALGQGDLARTHLRQFLELYQSADGWRSNAISMLDKLGAR
ncbi:MAG: hypothetical protein HOP28_16875 [Gemmatimonadales bacterium]|nr:hypothetical protein [Gemmatimonadales bacterium]